MMAFVMVGLAVSIAMGLGVLLAALDNPTAGTGGPVERVSADPTPRESPVLASRLRSPGPADGAAP
jgi:hypothetical protein